jgi:DNA-binding SARP family transcriptional activator
LTRPEPGEGQQSGEPPAGPLRLKLLGLFRPSDAEGRQIEIQSKKNKALLALVALSKGREMTREKLCALLWDGRNEEQARSSLRQSLAVMRQELGQYADALTTRDNRVGIDERRVQVDVEVFQAASRSTRIEDLTQACEYYDGELLADVMLREESFEEWWAGERRRLADCAMVALQQLAGSWTRCGSRLIAF